MQRDKYFEAEKKWLRVEKECDELAPYARRYYSKYKSGEVLEKHILWEPLEKPVFAGWEVSVGLCESGARRRDAADIIAVLDALGATKPLFWRKSRYLSILRRHKYVYKSIDREFLGKWYNQYHITGQLFNRKLDEKHYNGLNAHLKSYFDYYIEPATKWRPEYKVYYLDSKFPTYELVLKVKKSYNTYIGHLYGDKIGEYEKLHRWLYSHEQMKVYSNVYGATGDYRQCFNTTIKRSWSNACKALVLCYNNGYEDWDDAELEIYRKFGTYNHKNYGYS